MILPRSVFGANEKIIMGHIGVKNQGTSNLKAFQKVTTRAAVCDVDRDVLGKAGPAPTKVLLRQGLSAGSRRSNRNCGV